MNPIRQHRLLAKMEQVDLARKMGVSRVTISRWENGQSYPSVPKFKELAEVLGCSMEELIDE